MKKVFTKTFIVSFLFVCFSLSLMPRADGLKSNNRDSLARANEEASQEVRFRKQAIQVGKHPLLVEIAETPEQTSRGLMFRTELKDGEGMLFIFEREQILSFWMKNTFIPLSIGYFSEAGVLVDIQDMEPMKSLIQTEFTHYPSRKPAKFALEVPRGWFEKNKVKIGDKLTGEGLPLVKNSRRK
jgi:uncharacterized membrane protein (UPF0127 family)